MKKIIGVSTALMLTVASFAQNEQIQNKNGVDIMPVQGEFGVGMNAIPALTYIGDIFGLTGSNTSLDQDKFINYFGSQTLFGKYMITDDNAIRVHLRYGQNNTTTYNYVFDDNAANPDSLVTDTYKGKQTDLNIGLGYEFRRGKNRLRGLYGGEILYQYSKFHANYSYGNGFGKTNAAPLATQWSGSSPSGSANMGQRIQSFDNGGSNGLGLRVFAGVEYYIAPKICLGTEFGWGVGGSWTKHGTTVDETWDPAATASDGTTGAVVTHQTQQFNQNNFRIDTDNFNGALYFLFWF